MAIGKGICFDGAKVISDTMALPAGGARYSTASIGFHCHFEAYITRRDRNNSKLTALSFVEFISSNGIPAGCCKDRARCTKHETNQICNRSVIFVEQFGKTVLYKTYIY